MTFVKSRQKLMRRVVDTSVAVWLLCMGMVSLGAAAPFIFGVCTHVGEVYAEGKITLADVRKNLDMMVAAGVKMYREDLYWHLVEPVRGQYNFTPYDTVVNEARARGLEPLLIFHGFPVGIGKETPWAPPQGSAEWMVDFERYCYESALHFKGRVKYWELWNEPTLSLFWNPVLAPGDTKEAAFGRLLIVGSNAIRRADPNAIILFGGPHALDVMDDPYEFVAKALSVQVNGERAFDKVDIIAGHMYYDRVNGSIPELHKGMNGAGYYKKLDTTLKNMFGASKRFWHTETGYSTSGQFSVSQDQQAALILRTYLDFMNSDGLVESMFQYDFRDDGTDPNQREFNEGMIKFDYTPKKLYYAFQNMTSRLEGANLVGKQTWTDAHGLIFTNPANRRVHALWTRGATLVKTVSIQTPAATVFSTTGTATQVTATPAPGGGFTVNLTLTGSPIFMEEVGTPVPLPPQANAGPDQTVTDLDRNGSQAVTLNGSGSSDPDGNIVSYIWRLGSPTGTTIAAGVSPTVTLPLGTHTIYLTVHDSQSLTATDSVVVKVVESIVIPPTPKKMPIFATSASINVSKSPNVKDGKTWSNWSVGGSLPTAWISVQLPSNRPISQVKYYGKFYKATVQYSQTGNDNDWQTFPGAVDLNTANRSVWGVLPSSTTQYNVSAKFVRFVISKMSAWDLGSFGEIELWGPDASGAAALQGTIDAGTLSSRKFLSPGLVDGFNDVATFGGNAQEVTVLDVNGRVVFQGAASESENPIITWDCRDERGRLVSSGAYVAKIKDKEGKMSYQTLAVVK